MACFGEILGANATPTATSDDNNVGFDDLGGVAGRELKEFILVVGAGFVEERDLGEAG